MMTERPPYIDVELIGGPQDGKVYRMRNCQDTDPAVLVKNEVDHWYMSEEEIDGTEPYVYLMHMGRGKLEDMIEEL